MNVFHPLKLTVFPLCTCRGQCRSQAAEESPERRSLGYCFFLQVLHGYSEQLTWWRAYPIMPAYHLAVVEPLHGPWLVVTLQADDLNFVFFISS